MLRFLRSHARVRKLLVREHKQDSTNGTPIKTSNANAWILHYASAPIIGGVEGIMAEHARVLKLHGHRVSIIAGRGEPQVVLPELDSRHPAVLEVQRELDAGRVPETFDALRATIRGALAEQLDSPSSPDAPAVFVHNAFTLHKNVALTAALADLAAEGRGRFIAWCHDLAWTNPLYLPVLHDGWPWDLLCKPCPGVTYVTISQERQEQLANLFGWSRDEVRFVPNGIDATQFLSASQEMRLLLKHLDWWERDTVLLAPVRMTRRKNLELAIGVVAEMKAAGQRPLLVVTGPPGPHNPRQDYATFLGKERLRLRVEEDVCFLSQVSWFPGRVGDPLVAELYRWADALLFPSLQEGFGLPMLEAGLARLPVFCADLSVLRETGGADVNYFSPKTTPVLLAEQIQGALAAPGPAALRRRVLREYNWEAIYQKGLAPLLNNKGATYDERADRVGIA